VRRASRQSAALLALTALASVLVAGRASAQSGDRPLLIISMTGGFLTGGALWTLDRQLASVGSGEIDSLALGRYFRTGYVIGVGATVFRSPHFGFAAEVAFLGLGTESRCAPRGPYAFDSQHINEQACLSAQGYRLPTNATAIQGGVAWRALPEARVQPYLRAIGGAALLGGSFVETRGLVSVPSVDTTRPPVVARSFLTESSRRELTWIATLSAGVMLELAPGYQLRFEARDILLGLPEVTGPAPFGGALPVAPTGDRTVQLPAFAVSLDLVLEPLRHPRRY
jgi:hypothetical protein